MKALYGQTLTETVEAVVALDGNDVLGMAAIYPQDGQLVLVAKLTDKARSDLGRCGHRRALLKAAHAILARARRWKLPVITKADTRYEGAERLLAHLGFVPKNGYHELT